MKVRIFLVGIQRLDGEENRVETTAVGHLRLTGDGQTLLTYTEQQEDGGETAVSVQCAADEVLVERQGAARSLLRLRRGARCVCDYATPYGSLALTTHTHTLQNALTATGGTLDMTYTLEAAGGGIDHTLHLRVEKYGL